MISKCKFVVIPALILMIAISPFYVKAETGVIKNTPEVNKTSTTGTTGDDSGEPSFSIKIQGNDSNWSQFDRMYIDWKIDNNDFPTSSIVYFEIIADNPTSADSIIYPVSNQTFSETASPLVWEVPDDALTGEYYLTAYVYTISSEPVLLSNSEGFYVERQVVTSVPAVKYNENETITGGGLNNNKDTTKPTGNLGDSGNKLVEPFDNNNYVVSKRGLEEINKSIVELEKYLNQLKERLNELKSVTDVVVPSVPTSTTDVIELEAVPVGWSEEYAQMVDSDNDQLPDEVELIIGSDPNKADTDGDGYEDGLEVKNGYKPLSNEKSKVSLGNLTDLEGKVISTSNEQGQKSNWLIKNGQKIYMTMPAT